MSYLHSKNIIHRDLKPANIFYGDNLFPKIGDFGLSKNLDDDKLLSYENSHLIGTPAFMPPEIYDSYTYGKEGDVYSFAILLYHMITLEKPFKNYSFYQLLKPILVGDCLNFNSNKQNCYKKLI